MFSQRYCIIVGEKLLINYGNQWNKQFNNKNWQFPKPWGAHELFFHFFQVFFSTFSVRMVGNLWFVEWFTSVNATHFPSFHMVMIMRFDLIALFRFYLPVKHCCCWLRVVINFFCSFEFSNNDTPSSVINLGIWLRGIENYGAEDGDVDYIIWIVTCAGWCCLDVLMIHIVTVWFVCDFGLQVYYPGCCFDKISIYLLSTGWTRAWFFGWNDDHHDA
jgi:hypothetical protein